MAKNTLILFLTISTILQFTQEQGTTVNTNDHLQVDENGNKCERGKHLDNGKCISNEDWCNNFDSQSGNCSECSKWAWQQNNQYQGDYCATHWWAWVLIILGSILLACLLAGAIYYCCCFSHGKKKKGYNEQHTYLALRLMPNFLK